MSLSQVLELVEQLSAAEIAQLEHHIQQKRHHQIATPDLSAFTGLSDDALWAIIDEPFDTAQQTRLNHLHEQRETRKLTDAEEHEVDMLISEYDRYILRRSKAMATLQARGIDVMGILSGR